jgi:acylphosphatase
MKKHVDFTITGTVQGVGFRYDIKETADKLGIRGYARNMRDGSVVIEVEGEENLIENFFEWCKTGRHLARIEQIKTEQGKIRGYREFEVY